MRNSEREKRKKKKRATCIDEMAKIDYKLNKDEREKGEKEVWSILIGDCQPEMVNKHNVGLVNNNFFIDYLKWEGGFQNLDIFTRECHWTSRWM